MITISKLIFVSIIVLLGLGGLLASFIVPHERKFVGDHGTGFGLAGCGWALGCFILAYNVLVG